MREKRNKKNSLLICLACILLGVLLGSLASIGINNSKTDSINHAKEYTDEQIGNIRKYVDEQIQGVLEEVNQYTDRNNVSSEKLEEYNTYVERSYYPKDVQSLEETINTIKELSNIKDRKPIVVDTKDDANQIIMVLYSDEDLYNIKLHDVDANLFLECNDLNEYVQKDKSGNEILILDRLKSDEVLFVTLPESETIPLDYLYWDSASKGLNGLFIQYDPYSNGDRKITHIDSF